MARTLSEAIKRQVLLNKDYDLATFLGYAESDMLANGASKTIDLDKFIGAMGQGDYNPASIIDVLKNVVPQISSLMSTIRQNFNMWPSYMVTGTRTASLLRSLQEMMVTMAGVRGEMGWGGGQAQFLKLKVLESVAIADNKIYLSTKAPQESLEKATILDLIYNP